MTPEEYTQEALRTYGGTDYYLDKLCVGALGLAGEAGEVADTIKKILFHSHELDPLKLGEELGDVLWYFTLICSVLGYSLEDIMQQNITKLQKRYPEGFDEERSKNRVE